MLYLIQPHIEVTALASNYILHPDYNMHICFPLLDI